MDQATALPEQDQTSPPCHQPCHQRPSQDLSVWHYRRAGVYYLRIRPRGCSARSFTVSLRSTDRSIAMQFSKDILRTLAVFHLDKPDAAWSDLQDRLKDIAEDLLTERLSEGSRSAYMLIYEEHARNLAEASSLGGFTMDQQRALGMGQKVMRAAQERLGGRPDELVGLVEQLGCSTPVAPSLPLSVNVSPASITFQELSTLFLKERQGNVEASTLNAIGSNLRVLSGLLGDLNIRTHTRDDMVALKERLVEGRIRAANRSSNW